MTWRNKRATRPFSVQYSVEAVHRGDRCTVDAEAQSEVDLWSIVQKGGRLEKALINSSDVDWSLTSETWEYKCWCRYGWHLNNAWRAGLLHAGREPMRGFTLSHLVLRISLAVVLLSGAGWLGVGVFVCVLFCFVLFCCFLASRETSAVNSFQFYSKFQQLTDHVSYSTGNAGN